MLRTHAGSQQAHFSPKKLVCTTCTATKQDKSKILSFIEKAQSLEVRGLGKITAVSKKNAKRSDSRYELHPIC